MKARWHKPDGPTERVIHALRTASEPLRASQIADRSHTPARDVRKVLARLLLEQHISAQEGCPRRFRYVQAKPAADYMQPWQDAVRARMAAGVYP